MPEFLVPILVAVPTWNAPFENDCLVFFLVPFFSFFSNKRCFVAKPWWGIRWEDMGLKILVFPRMELLLPGLNHPSAPQHLVMYSSPTGQRYLQFGKHVLDLYVFKNRRASFIICFIPISRLFFWYELCLYLHICVLKTVYDFMCAPINSRWPRT